MITIDHKENRKYVLWGIGLSIVSFIIFKLLYPYPDFFSDSYSYLEAAYFNLDIAIWPIGYSKFLCAFHQITYSDTALIAFQYFFLQAAAIYFYFTILNLYRPANWAKQILFVFLFVNPLSLYLCNYVNSDALFAALSLFWITQLICIVDKPKNYQIFIHALLLFLCFTVRNNAYYYPLIAIIAFILSNQSLKRKLSGIILPFALIIPFIVHSENEAFKITGTRQFSLFTGWQLANNALYIYDQIVVDSADLPTSQAKELNSETVLFLKHVNPAVYRDYLESYVGNFFIRQGEAPLKQYYSRHYAKETSEIAAWGKASADFAPFGKYIIVHNLMAYIRYFMLPNIWHYFDPPLSHLEKYNYGTNQVDIIAKVWFHYPSTKISAISYGLQGFLLIYAAFFLVFNLYYVWYMITYIRLNKLSVKSGPQKTIMLTAIFLIINLGFSIFATVNILRYQFVPMIILLSFSLLMSDYLKKMAAIMKKEIKIYASHPGQRGMGSNINA